MGTGPIWGFVLCALFSLDCYVIHGEDCKWPGSRSSRLVLLNPNLGIRNNLSVTYPHFISLMKFEHRRRGVICNLGCS